MAVKTISAKKILETALELAEKKSWREVRLSDIANVMGISLSDIREHFHNKNELIDAWFDQATQKMLQTTKSDDFLRMSFRQRIEELIMSWLFALSSHQRVTKEMIYGQLKSAQIYSYLSSLSQIRSTMQWIREAAIIDTEPMSHTFFEESGLTLIFVSTFVYWLQDSSSDYRKTRKFLERELMRAETMTHFANHWVYQPLRKLKQKCWG